MTSRTCRTAVFSLIFCMAFPAWGQQYLLYSPQPAPPGMTTPSQDGILVQEIEIQKGDTLYDLSRKFSGRGMYFPQILLFNSIKNPDLIYPGKTLRIPVTNKEAHDSIRNRPKSPGASHRPKTPLSTETKPTVRQSVESSPDSNTSTEFSPNDRKPGGSKKNVGTQHKKKSAARARKPQAHATSSSVPPSSFSPSAVHGSRGSSSIVAADAAPGQKLFEAAVKAYRKDDYSTSLELFDRYLADYPGSSLAADATLYKAECFLKLSAQ